MRTDQLERTGTSAAKDQSHRTRAGRKSSLPGYIPGLVLVSLLAGLFLGWQLLGQRSTATSRERIVQADADLVNALRTDDTDTYARASGLYLDVLDSEADNVEALRGAAIADLGLHRFDQALDRSARARDLRPNDHVVLAALFDANIELGRYDQATTVLGDLFDVRPGLQAYTRLSYLRQLTGDDNGALEALFLARSAADGLGPESARVDSLLGEVHHAFGYDDAALGFWADAFAADQSRVDALVGQARINFENGDAEGAMAAVDGVLEDAPGETAALILGAEVNDALGNTEAALEMATAVGDDALAEHQAGFGIDPSAAIVVSSWGDPVQGLEIAQIMFDARPRNTRVAHAYAWALHRADQTQAALDPLETALQFDPTDEVLHAHAASILSASGETDRAAIAADRAEAISRRN